MMMAFLTCSLLLGEQAEPLLLVLLSGGSLGEGGEGGRGQAAGPGGS